MIKYVNKPGLDAHLAKSSHWAINVNGVWHTSNDVEVQHLIDTYTLDQAKDWVKKQIDAYAAELLNARMAGVSPAEMASWPMKYAEAVAYRKNPSPASAPMLNAEAAVRGVTLESIVARVEANAPQYMMLEATYRGAAGKHKDAIMAAATFEEIRNYDWRIGWPE